MFNVSLYIYVAEVFGSLSLHAQEIPLLVSVSHSTMTSRGKSLLYHQGYTKWPTSKRLFTFCINFRSLLREAIQKNVVKRNQSLILNWLS